jgi:dodecin
MLGSFTRSFENAVDEGIECATGTLRNVASAWVKDMNVLVQDGNITEYKTNLANTFVPHTFRQRPGLSMEKPGP